MMVSGRLGKNAARVALVFGGLGLSALTISEKAHAADALSHIDAARGYMQKGDIARTAHELEVALLDLQDRLGRSLSDQMPAPLSGWAAEEAEYEGLGSTGGGLSVTRGYTKGDASLNASLILDNPAVDEAQGQSTGQAAAKTIKLGNEDATLRWDSSSHSGEITVVLSHRVLIQITGDSLDSDDALMTMAKSMDMAKIRKIIGL